MRRLLFILLLTCAMASSIVSANHIVYDSIPQNCEYADGAFYQPNLSPLYEYRNRRLVLVDWNTSEVVRELETSLELPSFRAMSWSPDCRFLTALINEQGSSNMVIWDAVNGGRFGTFENAQGHPRSLGWDPTSTFVGVRAGDSVNDEIILWNIHTGSRVHLDDGDYGFTQVHWDFARNQLLAIWGYGYSASFSYTINGNVVYAYDLNSGSIVAQYAAHTNGYWKWFEVSSDNNYLIISSDGDRLDIYQRDTMANQIVDVGYRSGYGAHDVSSDGRYLWMLSRDSLRVWDTQNLIMRETAPFRHIPLVRITALPDDIADVRFVDGSTIDVVASDGSIRRWNFFTGEEVPLS